MSDPRHIRIEDYDYDLPEERIARYPLPQRDASRLLTYKDGHIESDTFRNLGNRLPEGSLLVFNDTRVIHARLKAQLPGGGVVEVFCLEPLAPAEYQLNFSSTRPVQWICLIGNNRKWKSGALSIALPRPGGGAPLSLHLNRGDRQHDGSFAVGFTWDDTSLAFGELLAQAGLIPLPPYLNREAEADDEDRYQTIYARTEGSVAAPTAGLHFTDAIFSELAQRNIHRSFVTLHVGAGTFRPVKSDTLADHDMHRETIDVGRALIVQLLEQLEAGRPIIPVGTTSLRTLESVYWYGVQCLQGRAHEPDELFIGQWEPYEPAHQGISAIEALRAALRRLPSDGALRGQTQLLIGPGYRYRLVDGLITNFHQPRSTLLLLVAALIGDDWQAVYEYALNHNYRFLSYGDSSLLWRRS